MCARVCVRVCARVCVRACVCYHNCIQFHIVSTNVNTCEKKNKYLVCYFGFRGPSNRCIQPKQESQLRYQQSCLTRHVHFGGN